MNKSISVYEQCQFCWANVCWCLVWPSGLPVPHTSVGTGNEKSRKESICFICLEYMQRSRVNRFIIHCSCSFVLIFSRWSLQILKWLQLQKFQRFKNGTTSGKLSKKTSKISRSDLQRHLHKNLFRIKNHTILWEQISSSIFNK